jgi:hypothetical protein
MGRKVGSGRNLKKKIRLNLGSAGSKGRALRTGNCFRVYLVLAKYKTIG